MDVVASHLLSRGTITADDLEQAKDAAARLGGQVSIALIRLGALSEKDLFDAMQELFGFEPAGPDALPTAEIMLSSIEAIGTTVAWCKTNEVVPWIVKSGSSETLFLGSRNPLHPQVQEIAEQWRGMRAELRLVSQQYMEALFSQVSGADNDRSADLRSLTSTETRLREMAEEAPVIDFVNAMFTDAVERRASDIHIEPREARFLVRMRIDGILVEWRAAPRNLFDAVASRTCRSGDGTLLPDPIDLIQSKLDTGRDKDRRDIEHLESVVRADYKKRLPVASLEEAASMLARYSEWQVLVAALENSSPEVRELAMTHLREFAAAGDPFSQAILEGRELP